MNTAKLLTIDDGRFLIFLPAIGEQIIVNNTENPTVEKGRFGEDEIAQMTEKVWDSEIESIMSNVMFNDSHDYSEGERRLLYAFTCEKTEDVDGASQEGTQA